MSKLLINLEYSLTIDGQAIVERSRPHTTLTEETISKRVGHAGYVCRQRRAERHGVDVWYEAEYVTTTEEGGGTKKKS